MRNTGPWDTSSGSLRIPVRWAFTATGYLNVPLLVWLALVAMAAVACARVARFSFSAFAWGALIILAVVLIMQGYWYFLNPYTPLEKHREQFTKGLEKRLRRCKRGPERAITAKQLVDFVEFFQGFILQRTMYYVNDNIIQPLTKRDAVSFAEMVGPSPVAWFVSHYWGTALRHFADSVRKHAQLIHGEDWKTNAYWICTFSNNQWAVEEELGNGQWQESSFYLALRDARCRGTAMVLDELALPLTRAWCLFEVLQTLLLSQQDKSFGGLQFCTSTGVINAGQSGTDVAMATAKRLANLDMCRADASNPDDLRMIRDLVEQMPGGFDSMNSFVRSSMRTALMAVNSQFVREFQELTDILAQNSREESDDTDLPCTAAVEPAAAMPTLLQRGASGATTKKTG
ncbi:FRAS1 [Symbiodinium necroappetens]|uniref:FRAS1 protein n=1 Tax=Symbiodinium necroappetens TaxID=1628268 RepID=A0A812ZXT5_9DINO|nr:FRAS1 [Symbiodinium necroappetens]